MARNRSWREREAKELARKKGKRPPHDRVLIVTEGSKTEPNYLTEIRQELRISSAHIEITHGDVTAPLQVATYAETVFKKTREYERVYAVFDRDSHDLGSYKGALQKARDLDGKMKNSENKATAFKAIASVPCFEFWLLLHYEDEQGYHDRTDIFRRIGTHIPRYSKGRDDIYGITAPRLAMATTRAANLRRRFSPNEGDEPYTDMDTLVAMLKALKA